jgi:hypothetical protein
MQKIKTFKGRVVCPRCDGQGLVYKATLVPLKKDLLICDECEALWLDENELVHNAFKVLILYLGSYGFSYKDLAIKEDEYDWYKESVYH